MQCSSGGGTGDAGGTAPVVINDVVLGISSIEALASPSSYTFTINTNQNWQITGIPAWMSVRPTWGSANGVSTLFHLTLTTIGINTVAGTNATLLIHGSLTPVASSSLISRSLSLTRSIYDRCGGAYGLPGASSIIAKWVSAGSAVGDIGNHSSATNGFNHPDSRLIFGIARGCGGTGSSEGIIKNMSAFRLFFYDQVFNTDFPATGNVHSFTNSPYTSVLVSSVSGYALIGMRIRDANMTSNLLLVNLFSSGSGIELCPSGSASLYWERSLSIISGGGTCQNTSAFPASLNPLKALMNAEITRANTASAYQIP